MLPVRAVGTFVLISAISACGGRGVRSAVWAQDAAKVGVVSHVKVLSDKVEDVSSPEAWKKTYIKDGMSDQEKVLAIWRSVVKYRHQCDPPDEYLQDNVHDVFKTIHVYGYGMCCCAASHVETLARYLGLEARGWAINVHSVPEVFYDGAWHLVDGSLMCYFLKPDGKIAAVADIKQAVLDWHAQHPGYRGNDGKLRQFAANGGWKKGPALLASTGGQFWDANGINLAGGHGWHSTMQEYDCKEFLYDYGGSMGYELNVQLRSGERLTRNWFNHGLHVNQLEGGDHYLAKDASALGMCRKLGDVAPGRIGNGVLEYQVPLADGAFRLGALLAENLATRGEDASAPAAVSVKDPATPAVLILDMPTSYVYLSGQVRLTPVVGQGGSITVAFSDNHGLDWTEVAKLQKSGPQQLDLKKYCYRRYDYRLKLELSGKGTGLDALGIRHDIQHSQAPLPALLAGDNTISFSAGPHEGTITLEGAMSVHNRDKERNLFYKAFHPEMLGGIRTDGLLINGKGAAIFPIATPGDMTRLRMNAFWRARDKRDGYDVDLSFDGGKTYKPFTKLAGPTAGNTRYVTSQVPPGKRAALVRLSGHSVNTTMLFGLRIDADYRQPHGGFRPVRISYTWEEGGKPHGDEHVATRPEETYTIHCGPQTVVKSYSVELAN
jgi:hypothetical protein